MRKRLSEWLISLGEWVRDKPSEREKDEYKESLQENRFLFTMGVRAEEKEEAARVWLRRVERLGWHLPLQPKPRYARLSDWRCPRVG